MNSTSSLRVRAASIAIVLGLGLSVTTGLSACSTGSTMMPADKSSAVLEGGAATDSIAVSPDAAVGTSSTTVERSTIETAYLQVASSNPKDAATKAGEVAAAAGGFVQDTSWSPANEYAPESVYLTIRVPASIIDTVLADLQGLGTLDSLSRSKSDVTLQVTDINARVTSLRSSLDALRALQAQSTTVSDLITVESAIAQRQAELDSLVAQQTYLADQVDLSTISMTLVGPTGTPTNQTFWDGLVAGWNSLGVAGSALLVAIGFILPWLVIAVVVAAVVVGVVLTVVRRRQARQPVAKKPAAKKQPATKK